MKGAPISHIAPGVVEKPQEAIIMEKGDMNKSTRKSFQKAAKDRESHRSSFYSLEIVDNMSPKRKRWLWPGAILAIMFLFAILITTVPDDKNLFYLTPEEQAQLNSGDISFMLVSTSMVVLMTPGLAFFYGGMVRRKNMISVLITSFTIMGVVILLWVIVGFSLAFGEDSLGGLIGNPKTFYFFRNVGGQPAPELKVDTIPIILYAMYQCAFAMLTPAIMMGAVAERAHFNAVISFTAIWHIVVYCPFAHMEWDPQGLLNRFGLLDFAGGTVVHMSSGMSALTLAKLIGGRAAGEHHHSPAHIPYVLLGTALLWFGWGGFNAGSEHMANPHAAQALMTTNISAAASLVTWLLWDYGNGKKITALGGCCGAVVGLIVITPACAYVSVGAAFLMGMIGGVICNYVCNYMKDMGAVDDNLDVFGFHFCGGAVGMLLLAFFASPYLQDTTGVKVYEGVFYGSGTLLWHTIVAIILLSLYCVIATAFIYKLVCLFMPFRVSEEAEAAGIDCMLHGEVVMLGTETRQLAPLPNGPSQRQTIDTV